MKMLDLFSGLGGWAEPWRDRGHDVVTVDYDPRFETTIVADLLEPWGLIEQLAERLWVPDVILASPPCEAFSVMTIGRNWTYDERGWVQPKSEKARIGTRLFTSTMLVVRELRPAFWVVENPRAMARHLESMNPHERRTVTYCQYGGKTQKPTDLWGGFPPSLQLAPPCQPRSSCHLAAPRGSRTGTQGEALAFGTTSKRTLAALRSLVPAPLSLAVLEAAEHDLRHGHRPVPTTLWGAL